MSSLPERLTFIDVETTGLYSSDRTVTLGLIQVDGALLTQGRLQAQVHHFVFDPGKKNHKRAEEVHGWHHWKLRHQNPCESYARDIKPLLDRGVLVAHNRPFDLRFIEHEFELLGLAIAPAGSFYTMQDWRLKIGGRCDLDVILGEMGKRRSGHARQDV